MGSSSCLYTLELLHVLRHGHFGRQPLHARGTEEPYNAIGLLQDVCRVLGRGDRPSVAASCMACTRSPDSPRLSAVLAPMVPEIVRPMCGTSTSAPASAILRASPSSNT